MTEPTTETPTPVEPSTGPPTPDPTPTTAPPPAPSPPKPAPPPAPAAHPDPAPQSVDDLPEWARKELATARGDAAKYRTRARDSVNEADQLNARVAQLETARRAAEVNVIAARHGITPEDADLFFSQNDDLAKVEKIAEALGQRRTGAVIPREGTGAAAKPGADPLAVFAKSLFTAAD